MKSILNAYCWILCWLMDHTDSDGWIHYHVVLLAESTTPNDY